MQRLYPIDDDFEATIRILTESEGGRKTPPFNGIRWDFSYAADNSSDQLYMIWPDFCSATGDSLPTDSPLPLSVCGSLALALFWSQSPYSIGI